MSQLSIRYTETHDWVRIEATVAVVGITDHAQSGLGDITNVQLPEVGQKVVKGQSCGVVESVKTATDLFPPLSGEVIETNTVLERAPEKINSSPYQEGWMYKITGFDPREVEIMMDEEAYRGFLAANT